MKVYSMKQYKKIGVFLSLSVIALVSCNNNSDSDINKSKTLIIKGLYSFGPEIKSFTECEEGREYWVVDSAKTLELEYSKFNFEKPYEPVYIEAQGYMSKSDTTSVSAGFDSTFVVTKLLKISKEIPDGPCSQ